MYIPRQLVSNLRYYTLFNDAQRKHFQSGLTFYCYYNKTIENSQIPQGSFNQVQRKIILRSVLSLDGDIIHQVRKDFLQEPNCEGIASAYYWLSEQLLASVQINFNLIAWVIAAMFNSPVISILWVVQKGVFAFLPLVLLVTLSILLILFNKTYYWFKNRFIHYFHISNYFHISQNQQILLAQLLDSLLSIFTTILLNIRFQPQSNKEFVLLTILPIVLSLVEPWALKIVFKKFFYLKLVA